MRKRPRQAETATQERSHEQVVRDLVSCFNARDLDELLELYTPDAALYEPFLEQPITGTAALRAFHEEPFRSFPDETLEIEQLLSQGEWVVARLVASATHSGEFLGMPPTGRRFSVRECTVFRFSVRRVQSVWVYVDSGSIARQLGYTFAPVKAPR
jgi:steroid delta-isomerase-like uncharacterized protein